MDKAMLLEEMTYHEDYRVYSLVVVVKARVREVVKPGRDEET